MESGSRKLALSWGQVQETRSNLGPGSIRPGSRKIALIWDQPQITSLLFGVTLPETRSHFGLASKKVALIWGQVQEIRSYFGSGSKKLALVSGQAQIISLRVRRK